MKRFITTTLLVLLPVVASAQLKVAIMEPEIVIDALPETAQVQAELQQFIQQREEAFQTRYQDWIDQITRFSENVESGLLNENQQRQEEEKLGELQEELSNLQNQIQRQIQQRQGELFNPILLKVDQAMEAVCEEMGIDVVINKQTSAGDPIVYYASQRSVDITQRVIQKLTEN